MELESPPAGAIGIPAHPANVLIANVTNSACFMTAPPH
jgi:hypothetical protein